MARFFSVCKKFEFALVMLLFLGASWLRFSHGVEVPGGFHGDEAVVGLEAGRILKEGSIGPYSPLALGQPSGPLYLFALSVRLFGPTIWAVRAVSALLGTLTVVTLYWMLRRHHGRTLAFLCATFLATLNWHIHFSRIGFPLIAWPLCVLAATFAALEALKRQQTRWWILSGFLAGLGIYVYNAHILFLLALGFWLWFSLARQRDVSLARRVAWLNCFAATVAFCAVPMARYALDPANDYFSHSRAISVFSTPDSGWPATAGFDEKAKFLANRALSFWDNLSLHSNVDYVDGTGIVPVAPLGLLILSALGIALTPKIRRTPLVALCLWCALFLPLGPLLTVSGLTRRAFALAPFIAFAAALGLVELGKRIGGASRTAQIRAPRQRVAVAGMAVVSALLIAQNLSDFFGHFAPAPQRAWIFVQDFTDTCAFLQTLPPDAHILFLSDRWSGNYEPRQFLLPAAHIEDRSKEFGTFNLDIAPQTTHPTFVLLGAYRDRLPELKQKYPRARVQNGPPSAETGEPSFVAVML